MVKCQNCGLEVDDKVKFCANCGSEIIREESNEADHTKFCANCGFKMNNEIKFCPSCGAPTSPSSHVNDSSLVVNHGKSPILAAILSFFIIGLGQIYLGLIKKGIILFVLAILGGILTFFIVGWIFWLLVWIYAIYDAYNSANKMNMGVGVADTIDLNDL